jgi:hypothetical protein
VPPTVGTRSLRLFHTGGEHGEVRGASGESAKSLRAVAD